MTFSEEARIIGVSKACTGAGPAGLLRVHSAREKEGCTLQGSIQSKPLLPVQPYFETTSQRYYERRVWKLGISHFYRYQIDDPSGATIAVPDGCIDFVFDCSAGSDLSGSSVIGTVLKHKAIRTQYRHVYFGVRFQPGVCPAMLRMPNGELIEQDVPMAEALDAPGLWEAICAAPDFRTQSQCFWDAYTAAWRAREEKRAGSGKACLSAAVQQLIAASGGRIQVKALAEKTGYSVRYIDRVFREVVGLGPKTFSQIVRFQKLLNLLHGSKRPHLTELADRCGYYDQSQCIRQFKTYTGTTPRAYCKMLAEADYSHRVVVTDFHLSAAFLQ